MWEVPEQESVQKGMYRLWDGQTARPRPLSHAPHDHQPWASRLMSLLAAATWVFWNEGCC